MSISIRGYVVDLEELRKIPGSNDGNLIARVESLTRPIAIADELASHRYGEQGPRVSQALRALIHGEPLRQDCYCLHVSTIELIVMTIGQSLPNENLEDIRSMSVLTPLDRLWENGSPLSIDGVADPACRIGHVTATEAVQLFDRWKTEDFEEADEEVVPSLIEIVEWFEEASRRHQGIVAFAS